MMLLDFLGRVLMNPGPAEKETGGSGLKFRRSYTFTIGSGNGRDCLCGD